MNAGRAMNEGMRKFRIVIRQGARKLTRHVRASDRSDAERQAGIIASALTRLPTLGDVAVISCTDIGRN